MNPAIESTPEVNPEMLTLARESRGLTQTQAAQKLGISQAQLSKMETSILEVPEGLLRKMAETYRYPDRFFVQRDRLLGVGTSEFYHRKRQATSGRKLKQVYSELNVRIMNISRLLRAVEIEDRIPHYDPDQYAPEEIARFVRASWSMPPGPVKNVTSTIEDAGGLVITFDFGTPQIDAISRYVPGLPLIFFVDRSLPGDRMRFTLAHELGHAIMHQLPHQDMEKQANQFAAEFLMPQADIKSELGRVDLAHLAAMKAYWKVSMAALLKRAQDLGKISQRTATQRWKQMSAAGYRTREPATLDIEQEQPSLINDIISLHRKELGYSPQDLSDLIMMCEDEMLIEYDIDCVRAEGKKLHLVR